MTSQYHILSIREKRRGPAFACVVELEDVMVQSLGGTLVRTSDLTRLKNKTTAPSFLFISGIAMYDIIELLTLAQDYLDGFDGIYAYVFDSIITTEDLNKAAWKKSISKSYRLAKKITRLFVPVKHSVAEFQSCYQIPVSYLPLASDVLQFGDASKHKFIDVNGYGRQDIMCSELLSNAYNRRGSNRIYYHTDHMSISGVPEHYAHRRFFWQILRGSKIALAFDALAANNNGRFTFSFVGQRWFESTAAGCVIVGKRPTCPEMNELFPLENSTIELPDDERHMLPFIEALLKEPEKLALIGKNNYLHALTANDWRHRISDMLTHIPISPPEQLSLEIEVLIKAKQNFVQTS